MLELKDINSFYGKAHILNDLSFHVDPGEVVALLGRNGAGKTTTIKTIMQLVRPRSGAVISLSFRRSMSEVRIGRPHSPAPTIRNELPCGRCSASTPDRFRLM